VLPDLTLSRVQKKALHRLEHRAIKVLNVAVENWYISLATDVKKKELNAWQLSAL
jgi:hypothetical protein